MTKVQTIYIGVDVAKATLQVHNQGRQTELSNATGGHAKLCQDLKALPGAQVICEATGGYERTMVKALHSAKIPVSVVNPAHARASAQAQGHRAKTDSIDARGLSDFGERYHPEPTPSVSQVQTQLAALTQWLTQLVSGQALVKTQAEHHVDAFVAKQHQKLLDHYQTQIEKVEAQLQALMDQDQELCQRVECLDSIEGVGQRTALLVLAHMPELGELNRQEVAALAGLAPYNRDSGAMKGMRCIGGGRPEVRRALYMPALTAMRFNPVLSVLYQRLITKGKFPKVALTALMRRLLIYMNAKLKSQAAECLSSDAVKIDMVKIKK